MTEPSSESLRDLRREYTRDALLERDLLADPIAQFDRWIVDAQAANLAEPNAMTLATADATGAPSARIVLLKEFDARGFVFFTNYESRKGRDLSANPRAALCVYWHALERQVRIEGTVERVDRALSEAYFHSRPIGSQVGAWVSHQSEVIPSREELDRREAELLEKFKSGTVPMPDYWGGYRVIPNVIEFWQGRASRLHDRIRYTGRADGQWTVERLAP